MKFCIHIDIDMLKPIVKRHLGLVEVLPRIKFWNSEILLLNRLEYFDKILQTHWKWQDLAQGIAKWHLSSVKAWYWQDLAQEIANWHFSVVEALPSS